MSVYSLAVKTLVQILCPKTAALYLPDLPISFFLCFSVAPKKHEANLHPAPRA